MTTWVWRSCPPFVTLYPSFYWVANENFSYACRPQSQGHIPRDQGNFYYMGAFLRGGGQWWRFTD